MDLIALLLGAIAVANPFIGVILTMVYLSLRLRRGVTSPARMMALFFVFPLGLAIWMINREPGLFITASDAVWSVGLCLLLFMYSLQKGARVSSALAHGSVLIIGYGILRYVIFQKFLTLANDQAVSDLAKAFPQMFQMKEMQASLATMRFLIPSSWIVPQVVALFAGSIIFQQLAGQRFSLRDFGIPKYYNFLILAVLPLYFFPQMHIVLFNSLIALCVLPVIQGIGVLVYVSTLYTSNLFMMILLTIIITLNLILVALLGFADIWFDFRKLHLKGTNS